MSEPTFPLAKSIDEIAQTGFYMMPDGIAKVSIQYDGIKHYLYGERGLEGVIFKDGRHYVRRYEDWTWTAWELKK